MVVPSSVEMGSLTEPTVNPNAAFSTVVFRPTSGSAVPRATNSLVLISRPAFLAAAAKSGADFNAAASVAAFSVASVLAFSLMTSLRTLSFTSSNLGTDESWRPDIATNAKPRPTRRASLTSPSANWKIWADTCADAPSASNGSSRVKKPVSSTFHPRVLATASRSAGLAIDFATSAASVSACFCARSVTS